MALVPTRVCDVFGTARNVKPYRIAVDKLDEGGDPIDSMSCLDVDLSPRGLKRVLASWQPPIQKKKEE